MATYCIKSRVFTGCGKPIFLLGGTLPLSSNYSEISNSITDHRIKGFRIVKTPSLKNLEYKFGDSYIKILNKICDECEDTGLDVIIPITTKKEVEETGNNILIKVRSIAETLSKYVNITYCVDDYIPSFPVVLSTRELISKVLIETHLKFADHSIVFPGIAGDIYNEYATRPTWLSAWAVGLSGDLDYLLSRYDKLGHNRPAKPILGYQVDNTIDNPYELRKLIWSGIFNKMSGFIGNTSNKHEDGEYINSLVTASDLWTNFELNDPKDSTASIVHPSFMDNDIYATVDEKKTGITLYGFDRKKYKSILLNLNYLKYSVVTIREYDLINGKVVVEQHNLKKSDAFIYTPSNNSTKDFLVRFTV